MIRPAVEGDLDAIIALVHALAAYEREPDSVRLEREEFGRHLFGPRPYAEVLMAETPGGEIAGFALFFHTFSTWEGRPGVWLEDLFVLPELRGNGYGRELLSAVARIALERGCARLEWSVLDWNEPAIGFYRHLDARAMDEWTTYRLVGEPLRALAGK